MVGEGRRGGGPEKVLYDADQKLLAFLGAVAFIIAALFWALFALRLAAAGSSFAAGGLAATVLSGVAFLLAWGLRMKMERSLPLTLWELRRLLIAGLFLGVAVGAVPYLLLHFKLKDPDFMHIASEPENLPPAVR
jgi:hypothetical protein